MIWAKTSLPWFICRPRDRRRLGPANAAIRVEIETRQKHKLFFASQLVIAPPAFNVGTALARDNNEHLTFGGRIHFGLGATLARVEAQVIFATLAQRYPHLQLRKRR